jgi:hypothetical protein
MATYHLYRWRVVEKFDNPYLAPELNPKALEGYRDEDNKYVRTSPIAKVNGKEITTESGSVYILEDIDTDYREWLAEQEGLEFDPDNPILIKKIK